MSKEKICMYCTKIILLKEDQEVIVTWLKNSHPMHYKCAQIVFKDKTSPIQWGREKVHIHEKCANEILTRKGR